MKRLIFLALLAICPLFSQVAAAQTGYYLNATGNPTFATNFPVDHGYINISNGNLHLEFPLATHKQRGTLSLNERLVYDSRIWLIGCYSSCYYWPNNIPNVPNTQGGWRFVSGVDAGSISYNAISSGSYSCEYQSGLQGYDITYTYTITWTDPSGSSHTFDATMLTDETNCNDAGTQALTQSINPGSAIDGSGYQLSSDQYGNPIVTDNSGNQVYPRSIDRYGNYWSTDTNGNLIDDLGRTPVITSTYGNVTYYDVLAPNGSINNNGTRVRYTVTTAPIAVSTTFTNTNVSNWNNTLYPVQSIQLPDGTSYTFSYDNFGELTQVILPTGGTVNYGYRSFVDSGAYLNRWVSSMQLGNDPATTFNQQVLSYCQGFSTGCQEQITIHEPVGGNEKAYTMTLNNGAWTTNMVAYSGSVSSNNPIMQVDNSFDFSHVCNAYLCNGSEFITKSTEKTTLLDTGQSSESQYVIDPYSGKPTAIKEWDYFNGGLGLQGPPPTTPTREVDYFYTGFDTQQIAVLDSSGNLAGQTNFDYVASPAMASGVTVGHDLGLSTGPYLHSVTHLLNTGTSPITSYTMDDAGSVRGISDPRGNATTITYQCNTDTFPYQITNALGQVTQYGNDCNSGALTSVQDPNDLAASRPGTTYSYDVAGRPNSISYPDGGQKTLAYPSATEVDTTTLASPDPSIVSQDYTDSFGRAYSHVVNGVSTETTYDSDGRVNCVTNPHLVGSPSPTDGSTCIILYDALGRPLYQSQPDGTSFLSWWYQGNVTSSYDESGRVWKRTYDSFGHLKQVLEPAPSDGTSTTCGPQGCKSNPSATFETDYVYDGLGNLYTATQLGGSGDTSRQLTFNHDSLGRLTSKSFPEAGVTTYSYVSGGTFCAGDVTLPCTQTDANGTTIAYNYDALNRPTSVTGPGISNHLRYDAPVDGGETNTIGRLVNESNYVDSDQDYSYDTMGRVTWQKNCLPSACATGVNVITASYDLAGNQTEMTYYGLYPNGRTVQQQYDAAGRLSSSSLTSVNGTSVNQSYVQSITYNPDGSPQTMILGNGVQQTITKNSRLQIQNSSVAWPQAPFGNQTFASHSYCYVGCPTGGVANNGNIWEIADTLNGANTQDFGYDSLNRVAGFALGGIWNQTFQTDSFGNLTRTTSGGPINSYGSNNRILNLPCVPLPGKAQFDNTGNQQCDGDNSVGIPEHEYVYDALNRISSVSAGGTYSASYTYDAIGNRSGKFNADGTYTAYVYFGGQPIAEYNSDGTYNYYIYANGNKIAKVAGSDTRIHMSGTTIQSNSELGLNLPIPSNISVRTGDRVTWRQYNTGGGVGGINVFFSNGSSTAWHTIANDGYAVNQNPTQNVWEYRTAPLDEYNGTTIASIGLLKDVWTTPGNWSIYIGDISIVHADGTVVPIGHPTPNSLQAMDPAYDTSFNAVVETVPLASDPTAAPGSNHTTKFYLGDQLGSTQLEFTAGGWPIWSERYTPFGQEIAPQPTNNNYKFAGMERDSESNLDHTQFRQYSFALGRWTSPDPYDGSMDISNPQTLNRYSYVGNMPLSYTDPTGLDGGASSIGGCFAVATGTAGPIGDAICGITLLFDAFILPDLFGHHHPLSYPKQRPNAQIWDEYHIHYGPNIAGALGLPQTGCEFGACGNSAVPGCTSCASSDHTLDMVSDPSVAIGLVWKTAVSAAKYTGCAAVGVGKGAQSFFGLYPPTISNGPPGPSTALRAARSSYRIATPWLLYRLGRIGPMGRLAGDLVPGFGEILMYGQGTLATYDGGKAMTDCASKVE